MRCRGMLATLVWSILVAGLSSPSSAAEPSGAKKAPKSPQALQAEIESLRVEQVAWRKIAWKTCLLEGLKASREERKPLVLWIFIDRPIDDERC